MPITIAQAQAAALKDNFLDEIGTEFQPQESFSELMQIAFDVITQAQANLHASSQISTGALSDSIQAGEPTTTNGILHIDIFMEYYGLFQNKGVKGTKGGSGPYSFKNEYPSLKMVQALSDWAGRGFFASRNTNPSKTPSKLEQKNASIGKIRKAYALARSIKQHGIKASGFLDRAITTVGATVTERLGLALRSDVIRTLPKTIGDE